MSTRAQIIIHDTESYLLFYRHSDGYSECVLPSLNTLLDRVRSGELRNNTEQFSGWLVESGRLEYFPDGKRENGYAWKVGAYEPSAGLHDDTEFLYVVDLEALHVDTYQRNFASVLKAVKKLCSGNAS